MAAWSSDAETGCPRGSANASAPALALMRPRSRSSRARGRLPSPPPEAASLLGGRDGPRVGLDRAGSVPHDPPGAGHALQRPEAMVSLVGTARLIDGLPEEPDRFPALPLCQRAVAQAATDEGAERRPGAGFGLAEQPARLRRVSVGQIGVCQRRPHEWLERRFPFPP